MIRLVLLFHFVVATYAAEELLKGLNFEDNLIDSRFGPENGYVTFNTQQPIPDKVNNAEFLLQLFEIKMI